MASNGWAADTTPQTRDCGPGTNLKYSQVPGYRAPGVRLPIAYHMSGQQLFYSIFAGTAITQTLTDAEGLVDSPLVDQVGIIDADAEGLLDSQVVADNIIPGESEGLLDSEVAADQLLVTTDNEGLLDSQVAADSIVVGPEAEGLLDSVVAADTIIPGESEGLLDAAAADQVTVATDAEGLLDSEVMDQNTVVGESEGLLDDASSTMAWSTTQSDAEGLLDSTEATEAIVASDPLSGVDSEVAEDGVIPADTEGLLDDALAASAAAIGDFIDMTDEDCSGVPCDGETRPAITDSFDRDYGTPATATNTGQDYITFPDGWETVFYPVVVETFTKGDGDLNGQNVDHGGLTWSSGLFDSPGYDSLTILSGQAGEKASSSPGGYGASELNFSSIYDGTSQIAIEAKFTVPSADSSVQTIFWFSFADAAVTIPIYFRVLKEFGSPGTCILNIIGSPSGYVTSSAITITPDQEYTLLCVINTVTNELTMSLDGTELSLTNPVAVTGLSLMDFVIANTPQQAEHWFNNFTMGFSDLPALKAAQGQIESLPGLPPLPIYMGGVGVDVRCRWATDRQYVKTSIRRPDGSSLGVIGWSSKLGNLLAENEHALIVGWISDFAVLVLAINNGAFSLLGLTPGFGGFFPGVPDLTLAGAPTPTDGDEVKAEINGTDLNIYVNDALYATVDVTTATDISTLRYAGFLSFQQLEITAYVLSLEAGPLDTVTIATDPTPCPRVIIDQDSVVTDPEDASDSSSIDQDSVVGDSEGLADSAVTDGTVTATDNEGLVDAVASSLDIASSDVVGLTDSSAADVVTNLTESVGLSDSTAMELVQVAIDALGLSDSTSLVLVFVASDVADLSDLAVEDLNIVIVDDLGELDSIVSVVLQGGGWRPIIVFF